MGMRWYAVLVKATDDEAREIAVAAQQLIPNLTKQIDASIVSLRSPADPAPWIVLRMYNFLNRVPECGSAPACIGDAFPGSAFQGGPGAKALGEIAADPHVALAIVASRMRGEATFVVCSDTLCCSGHLRFKDGALVSGEIYGWGGNETLWSLSANSFRAQEIELTAQAGYNYYKPVADGLIQTLGPGADELFLSPTGGGTDGEWLRYHILTKRQPISPVVAKPEHAEQPATTPVAGPNIPESGGASKTKRPWWKFW
jgi:hypothetical protein